LKRKPIRFGSDIRETSGEGIIRDKAK